MTQAAEIFVPTRAREDKLIAGVCIAHFVSHYYMMLLAPLFVFIKDDYGVTYTELSLALAAFGVVSAVLQTPVGFFVDHFGARLNLIGGLLLGSAAVAVAGLVDSFWVFIAMFAVMGLANTVYHPADYALLSERVTPQRIPQVFSFHTCSGMIGSAVAPGTLLFMQSLVGWRGAFVCAAVLGIVAALILALQGEPPRHRSAHASKPRGNEPPDGATDGWRLLLDSRRQPGWAFPAPTRITASSLSRHRRPGHARRPTALGGNATRPAGNGVKLPAGPPRS